MLTSSPFRDISVEFTVPGEPATKARARVVRRGNKVHAFTPEATKRAEGVIKAAFLQAVKRLAPSDLLGFGVEATFHISSGNLRRDVDNMLKVILDGLNKVAWADDWQVTEVIGRKVSAPRGEGRTDVRIYTTGVLEGRPLGRCEKCGETFPRPPSHAAKKYCSDDCRRAARLARIARTCPQCSEKFHAQRGDQQYCSTECNYAAKHVEVTCANCGVVFTKARSLSRRGNAYCSAECKATYWREHRKSAAKGICGDCGGPTTKTSYKRCRDCSYAAGGRWTDRDPT